MLVNYYAQVQGAWPEIVAAVHALVATVLTAHIILSKDDPRAAIGWIGVVWLSPVLGPLFYFLLGINRIRRRAIAIMGRPQVPLLGAERGRELLREAGFAETHLEPLVQIGDHVVGFPLTTGNRITPLVNGEEAYPAMLAAISRAETSVMLSTYIFDNDELGRQFVQALAAAVKRGVQVRVLVDATGARYSFPEIVGSLRRAGVPTARFMPGFVPTRVSAFNLRNHRKILVVDGRHGFTGGMNIRQAHFAGRGDRGAVQDLHFAVEGPVVAHLRQAFVEDWVFTTREVLRGPVWTTELAPAGKVLARGVLDGPDSDFEKILWTVLGAIMTARSSIKIVTPYFLPEPTMLRFLNVAALSGVRVDIIIPERSNIRLVQWATMAMVAPLLAKGCRIHLGQPPFDHSKLLIVDDAWAFIGSANWDERSFRLNFEFNIECLSRDLATELDRIFAAKLLASRPLTMHELEERPLPWKLRDGLVRLAAPYL